MQRYQAFLERIGLPVDLQIEKTYDFLKEIQYRAVLTIPYENLDILRGIPLSLDADALFEKIVEKKRGGYCFEVNALLSHMLKEMGFSVLSYFARYVRGEETVPMRRHRILAVECEDGLYMCDIGVGQIAPRYPVKMEEGLVQEQFGEMYRFEKDADAGWVLFDDTKGEWVPYITFTEEKQYEVDFIQPSFYYEKHPDSVFNKTYMLAIKTPTGRKTVDGNTYKEFTGTELTHIEENLPQDQLSEIVKREFLLDI